MIVIDFRTWDGVKKAVIYALRRLVAEAKGTVVGVNASRVYKVIYGARPDNGDLAPAHAELLIHAIMDVAGDCIVTQIRKRGGRRKGRLMLMDTQCLKQRLGL